MEHFEIPKSFLKLPLVSNITEEPNQNYDLPVRGQIHGEKYRELLDFIVENDSDHWKQEIAQILEGNAILEQIQTLSFSQFLDYLIHIAYANSVIDWNSISILEQFLKSKYDHISRWALPDLDFTADLSGFHRLSFKLDFPSPLLDHISNISKNLKDELSTEELGYVLSSETLTKLKMTSIINMEEYLDLISNLSIIQQTGIIRYEQYSDFIAELSLLSESLLQLPIIKDSVNKVLFIIHYIMAFIKDEPKSIEKCQHLLNLAISELNHLDADKKRSYLWLTDAVKAMIVNEVTKFNMEMVTEDLLLRSIGDRFLNPENTDLQTWMHAINTTELPSEIIIILIRGYLSVEQILHRYYLQLPKTDTNNLVTLNNFVFSLLKSYDAMYYKATSNHSYYLEYFLMEGWANAGLNQAKITPKINFESEPLIERRINDSIFSDYFELVILCNQIIDESYPFEDLFDSILRNGGEFNHLIGNETFATIFVDKFAKAFNYAQQRQINGVGIPINHYIQLTYFMQSWLPYLLRIEEHVQDTIIMYLSFLKVVVNMIEAYYSEKGRFKAAKLWDLNYTLFELNLFVLYGYPQLNNINKMLSPEHIFNDFLKMLKHFDLNREITTIDKRYLVIDTVYDVSKFNLQQNQSSVKPEKLMEHNIMEYLEMRNSLDTFLNDLGSISLDQIRNYFDKQPFRNRNPPLTLLDHLDLSKSIDNLSFPFIQPLNAFSAAIQFFDLDVEFPTIKAGSS